MPAATLARLVLLEARRGGLPWLVLGCIALAVALAGFLSHVAVTESLMLQAALVAALLRVGAVFLIAAQVAGSTLREINDKALELALSLPVSRLVQYIGRLSGFVACALAISAAFSLPLLLWAPPGTVALWGLSLALECALVATATMFFAMVLGQLVPTIAAVAGLYLLGRSIAAIQGIASGPLADASAVQEIARKAIDATAFLLPRLDLVTRTEWLLYGPPSGHAYVAGLAGLVLYAGLLLAAGLVDFHRKNL